MSLFDNRTHLQDCENNAEVSPDTTAAPTAAVNDAGAVIEGTNSIAFQVDDAQEFITFEDDSTGTLINVDMSDVTVYMNVKHNLGESFANLGGQICFGDGLSGAGSEIVGYNVNGNDVAGFPYLFRFTTIKIDVSVIVAAPGTEDVDYFVYVGTTESNLDHTAVLQIGYGSFNVEKAISTGKNAWIDGIYYIANSVSSTTGYAVSIEGGTSGTPETMVDVAADDITVGMGLFNNPKGSEFGFFGPTQWGDGAAGDAYFTGTDEQWFWIGNNAGGHVIADTHFPFRLVGVSGSVNSWVLTRVVIVGVSTRAQFDMSDAEMDFVQMVGCTLVDIGTITMPLQDADKFINATVFINCDQMDLQSLDMDGNTWIGSTDANGVILFDATVADPSNQDNSEFQRVGTHNAIEIAPVGAGPFTYNLDGYTFDGFASQDDAQATEAEKVFFVNPATLSADININLTNSQAINIGLGNADDTGSDGFSWREVGSYTGTVTILATITLSVQVNDLLGNAIEDVFVSIRRASDNVLQSEGRTDVAGLYEDTAFNFASETAVNIFIRQGSSFAPRWFPVTAPGTIESTGMSVTVALNEDTISGGSDASPGAFDISRQGVISRDTNGTVLTAEIRLPPGVSRKLIVGCGYWDSTVNRGLTSLLYDGNAMTDTGGGTFVQEGSEFHEIFLFRHDIPDGDEMDKPIVMTLDGTVPFRFLGAAVIQQSAAGAEEDDASQTGNAVTGNPTISLNNTTQPAIDVMFVVCDDVDTLPGVASGVGQVLRSEVVVDDLKQISIVIAKRTATGAHSIGIDYDAASKSWVAAGATFPD